jgi:hypothetical protein
MILRYPRYIAESFAANLFPRAAHVRSCHGSLDSLDFGIKMGCMYIASCDSLAAIAGLRDSDPLEVYGRVDINNRESTTIPSLQTCMCMYSCTVLCVHDRYRDKCNIDESTQVKRHARPAPERIDRSRHTFSCNESTAHWQTSLFEERRLEIRSRALAEIGVRIRRERRGCKTCYARTGQRPCRCFTTNHSDRGFRTTHRSLRTAARISTASLNSETGDMCMRQVRSICISV